VQLEGDEGVQHTFVLPNSYYVPKAGSDQLFSPQHWSRELRKSKILNATCTTGHKKVTLKWVKLRLTVPLNPRTNVATVYTCPGYNKFTAFCALAGFDGEKEDSNLLAYDATADANVEPIFITDDEDNLDDDQDLNNELLSDNFANFHGGLFRDKAIPNTIATPTYDNVVLEEENTSKIEGNPAILLDYHY
jgi:hypothetical protein